MLKSAVSVRALDGHKIWVRFDDGAEGTVDVSEHVPFTGVFERLKDRTYFSAVSVHPELKVVTWPDGQDIDSEVLYSWATGAPLPEWAESDEI